MSVRSWDRDQSGLRWIHCFSKLLSKLWWLWVMPCRTITETLSENKIVSFERDIKISLANFLWGSFTYDWKVVHCACMSLMTWSCNPNLVSFQLSEINCLNQLVLSIDFFLQLKTDEMFRLSSLRLISFISGGTVKSFPIKQQKLTGIHQ